MNCFETERILVRQLNQQDVDLIFAYSQEECTQRELPDEYFESLKDAEEGLKFLINQYDKGYPLVYAIVLKERNLLIGHVSLSRISEGIEIGYAIATSYQGSGFATELIKEFTPWAKKTFQLDVLYGIAKKSNKASWKVLENCGYLLQKEEGRRCFGGNHLVKVYTC